MMIWSKMGIPKSSPASLSLSVSDKSSGDGFGSPDGWLCYVELPVMWSYLLSTMIISGKYGRAMFL